MCSTSSSGILDLSSSICPSPSLVDSSSRDQSRDRREMTSPGMTSSVTSPGYQDDDETDLADERSFHSPCSSPPRHHESRSESGTLERAGRKRSLSFLPHDMGGKKSLLDFKPGDFKPGEIPHLLGFHGGHLISPLISAYPPGYPSPLLGMIAQQMRLPISNLGSLPASPRLPNLDMAVSSCSPHPSLPDISDVLQNPLLPPRHSAPPFPLPHLKSSPTAALPSSQYGRLPWRRRRPRRDTAEAVERVHSVTPDEGADISGLPPSSTSTDGKGASSSKDADYFERRRKNNEAAKRSRDARRIKEEGTAHLADYLQKENIRLQAEVQLWKNESAKLHSLQTILINDFSLRK